MGAVVLTDLEAAAAAFAPTTTATACSSPTTTASRCSPNYDHTLLFQVKLSVFLPSSLPFLSFSAAMVEGRSSSCWIFGSSGQMHMHR
jgi:hypothetical protein